MRLAWNAFRGRMFATVLAAGYTDLQPSQVLLFRYPTIAGMRPTELAEEIGISKQAMNDVLRQLERNGYLELRADPDDRRAKCIVLTERGAALADVTRAAAQEVSEEWAQAVGRERFDAFRATLAELVESAGRNADRGR